MVTHEDRCAAARASIEFICSRSEAEMALPVPNCPGWTIYNAAVHVGRVGVAWHSMIMATPDDPDSRVRGYADAESRGSGHAPDVLASWATAAVDALDRDVETPCYFSMTGGAGTVGLWGWHAASELAVHRLDIEQALGESHAITDALAFDAIEYTAQFFLPAMARVTEEHPDAVAVVAEHDGSVVGETDIRAPRDERDAVATITGAPVDVLLALWGRPHGPVSVDGNGAAVDAWHTLPSTAFQFGTWD